MQRRIPNSASHKRRKRESPLLLIIRAIFYRMHETFGLNAFADVFPIYHVFTVEVDD